MNKLLITFLTLIAILIATPSMVKADGGYGQDEDEEEEEKIVIIHETVDTAISDYINPSTVGAGFVFVSGALFAISKKLKAQSI